MVTSESQTDLDDFGLYLKSVYPETRTNSGDILNYVGMTFDFTITGQVCITMLKCVDDILSGYYYFGHESNAWCICPL